MIENSGLESRAWLSLAIVASIMGAILFACAGTLRYWQAWTYMGVYFSASISITLYLLRNDPALLERRMHGGPTAEKTPGQRLSMAAAALGFIAGLAVPALDRRWGWSQVPVWAVAAGDALVALGFYGVFRVFRENPFAAATVDRFEGQRIVATGPYAWVRHPMYAWASFLFVGGPPALGSWWGLLDLAAVAPALIWRLLDEERMLKESFPEYADYCRRVRWRLLPGIF